MRKFETGATRDDDKAKLDYEGFESPLVMRRFAEYMHSHRVQADGNLRDSDNWQKGIPTEAYMKSMFRHFMDLWLIHRGQPVDNIEEVLCAIRFNVNGYLHEVLKNPKSQAPPSSINEKTTYWCERCNDIHTTIPDNNDGY